MVLKLSNKHGFCLEALMKICHCIAHDSQFLNWKCSIKSLYNFESLGIYVVSELLPRLFEQTTNSQSAV